MHDTSILQLHWLDLVNQFIASFDPSSEDRQAEVQTRNHHHMCNVSLAATKDAVWLFLTERDCHQGEGERDELLILCG